MGQFPKEDRFQIDTDLVTSNMGQFPKDRFQIDTDLVTSNMGQFPKQDRF